MSDGVWAAQLVDPDGHEETISSADPNTIVWWLERQAQRLDPKPACGLKGCLVREAHFHAAGGPAEPGATFWCPKTDGCDELSACLAEQRCHAIPLEPGQVPVLRPDRCWAAQCSTPWECTAAGRCPQAPLNAP